MAELSKIRKNGVDYDIKDATARAAIEELKQNGTGLIENISAEKPLVYINGMIPTTKDNVLATMTVKSKWLNIFAYIKIKCQGSSSMAYPKKNFTVTLYQDKARTIPLEIAIPGWKYKSNKFVLKANYIDHLHARNIISARLWSEVVASRSNYNSLPTEFRNSPNNGAIDGFPIIVYTNGSYQGIYTWNIGKDAWLWGMDESNADHVLMCAETNTNRVFAETPCNFRALWSGTNGEYWKVEVGTNSDSVKNALNALITCVKDTTDDEFKAQISNHLDVQSAIDYAIFSCFDCGIDNLGKNMLLGKYTPQHWIMGRYDNDSTYGLNVDGKVFRAATTAYPADYQESFSLLFERIQTLYAEEMQARALELRSDILSYANVASHFEHFCAEIGAEAYADDLIPYPDIPSDDTNNIWQIRNFVRDRGAYFDVWVNKLTGPDWQLATDYEWKTGYVSNKTIYGTIHKSAYSAFVLGGTEPFFALGNSVSEEYTNVRPLAVPENATMLRVTCPGLAVMVETYGINLDGAVYVHSGKRKISEPDDNGAIFEFDWTAVKYITVMVDGVTGNIPDSYDWSKVSIEFA